jgi:hypothetical protein
VVLHQLTQLGELRRRVILLFDAEVAPALLRRGRGGQCEKQGDQDHQGAH